MSDMLAQLQLSRYSTHIDPVVMVVNLDDNSQVKL